RYLASSDEPNPNSRPSLKISRNGQLVQKVTFQVNERITAYAILPRRPSLNLAILAVAYLDNHDEAFLVLYNAESGEPLRQLTGHLTQINSLAFSANGKLLASTAEDQVVCIWGVADLDQILGKHGRLVGVAVEQRPNNDLVVADVAEDSPLRR